MKLRLSHRANLREMERDGIIARRDFKTVPPKVEYSATSFGQTLNEALCPLAEWGLQHEGRLVTALAHG